MTTVRVRFTPNGTPTPGQISFVARHDEDNRPIVSGRDILDGNPEWETVPVEGADVEVRPNDPGWHYVVRVKPDGHPQKVGTFTIPPNGPINFGDLVRYDPKAGMAYEPDPGWYSRLAGVEVGFEAVQADVHTAKTEAEASAASASQAATNAASDVSASLTAAVASEADRATTSANQAGTIKGDLETIFLGGTEAVNDAAVQQFVSTEGTATRESLVGTFLQRSSQPVDASRYATLQEAVNATATGGVLSLTPGAIYSGQTIRRSSSIEIRGNGATILQTSDTAPVILEGSWASIEAVSSVQNVDYTFEGGGVATPVTRLTVGTIPASLSVQDVVKVVSDDVLPGTPSEPPSQQRKGEFATVGHIDTTSGHIYLTGRVRENYATNPRIAVPNRTTFSLIDLNFDTLESGDAAGWASGYAIIRDCQDVTVRNLECPKGYGGLISLRGVFGFDLDNIKPRNLRNQPSLNRYGYGINLTSSEDGTVSSLRARNVRHAITTNVGRVEAGSSDIGGWGATAHVNVVNGHCRAASNASFDTHEGSYEIHFLDCTAVGDWKGYEATGAGFQGRGKHVTFSNCRAVNCRNGFVVFNTVGSSTENVTLINCKTMNCSTSAIQVTGISGHRIPGVRVIGGQFEVMGPLGIQLTRCDADFQNVELQLTTPLNSAIGWRVQDSTLKARGGVINMAGVTGTSGRVIAIVDSTSSVKWDRGRIQLDSAPLNRFVNGPSGGGNPKAELTNTSVDVAPPGGSQGLWDITGARFGWLSDAGTSSAGYLEAITANGQVLNIASRPDLVVQARVSSSSGSWTTGALPDGYVPGQTLSVYSLLQAGSTLTIPAGSAGNTDATADIVISRGGVATFVWNGSDWVFTGKAG